MNRRTAGRGVLVLLAVTAVGSLAAVFAHFPAAERPQTVRGDDVLSVAFGDARSAISLSMARRADVYFHGGVEMSCTCAHGEEGGTDHAAHCDHDSHDGAGSAAVRAGGDFLSDPWAWINRRIRAPQIDRHLEKAKAAELMPWYWAAVKVNPRNIQAWSEAAFSAGHIMGRRDLQLEILARGIAANPESIVLGYEQARAIFNMGKGDARAAEREFERIHVLARAARAAGGLAENDARAFASALHYLSLFAEKRRDMAALRNYRDEIATLDAEGAAYIRREIVRRIDRLSGKSGEKEKAEKPQR